MIDQPQINEYFKQLCKEHKLIKHSEAALHFFQNQKDFDSYLKSAKFPTVISANFEGQSRNNNADQYMADIQIPLAFLSQYQARNSQTQIVEKSKEAATIMLDFITRIRKDAKNPNHFLFKTFNATDFTFSPYHAPANEAVGYECIITLTPRLNLLYKKNNWE